MKNSSSPLNSFAFLGLAMLATTAVFAQVPVESTSTVTTTSAGTVSQFGGDAIVIKSTTSDAPISYSSTKTTTYVDENGNTVSTETVKSGLPVTVYYEKVGDRLVATKVMVRKVATTDVASPTTSASSTTTTTSAGTVSQFSPDAIVIRTTTTAAPVSYSSTKTTTYVDEDGNTVSSETVKSGLPVTVYYNKVGDQMVATKVVVKKTTSTTTTTP